MFLQLVFETLELYQGNKVIKIQVIIKSLKLQFNYSLKWEWCDNMDKLPLKVLYQNNALDILYRHPDYVEATSYSQKNTALSGLNLGSMAYGKEVNWL